MHSHQPLEIQIIMGVIRILIAVSIGTAIGSILQYKGWIKYISFLVKPLFKFGRLPSICGTSFLTALVSNIAAAAMLADAYRERKITKKEMISGGILNSFPAHMSHLARTFFIIIPLLGPIALIYILITFFEDLFRTVVVLLYTRKTGNPDFKDFNNAITDSKKLTWNEIFHKTGKRVIRTIKRVACIYTPLFILITYAAHNGLFNILDRYVPELLKNILSPEVFTILISKLGGLTASASVAMGLLEHNQILPIQVVFALMLGNMLTIPFSMLRRNLPTALGIYPGKDGLWVVVILGSMRFILNFIAVVLLALIMILKVQTV